MSKDSECGRDALSFRGVQPKLPLIVLMISTLATLWHYSGVQHHGNADGASLIKSLKLTLLYGRVRRLMRHYGVCHFLMHSCCSLFSLYCDPVNGGVCQCINSMRLSQASIVLLQYGTSYRTHDIRYLFGTVV
jgi:hypothetical protein